VILRPAPISQPWQWHLAARGADVAAVKREAARTVAERLLLEEDAIRSIAATKQGTLAKLVSMSSRRELFQRLF
jgi:hypothetical protein